MSIQILHMLSSCGTGDHGLGSGWWLWALMPCPSLLSWPCLWAQVCAFGLGIACFCWERRVVCTWVVDTCMLYSGKFLFTCSSRGLLSLCVSSFLPLWILYLNSDRHNSGPKFLNTGCEKRKQKRTTKKRGGRKKVQINQMLATSCAFTQHLLFKRFFLTHKCRFP